MLVLKTLIIVVQLMSALGVIGLVLLQHGKGADMGAAFGSGASGSLFGATGSAKLSVAYHRSACSDLFCHHAGAHVPRFISRQAFCRLARHGSHRSGGGVVRCCSGWRFGCRSGCRCVDAGPGRAEINFREKWSWCVEQTV